MSNETAPPNQSREKRSRKALRATLAAIDSATGGRPLALALAEAMRAEGELGPQERRAAANAARGVLRELRRIDVVLAQAAGAAGVRLRAMEPHDKSLARYLALRVSIEGEPAARPLGELKLPGPRRPRGIDDAVLARLAAYLVRADELVMPADPVSALGLRRSVPDFLARRFAEELGVARADSVLAALNRPARLDLRANRLITTRDTLAERLRAEGAEVESCALSPDGLVAIDRAHLFGSAHREGWFEVQDEGSQLIALLCGASPGETAIDLCAGSGGKTLALAAQVGRGGRVLACDPVAHRLSELPARARRAKASGIIEVAGAQPPESIVGRADVVLVDAPCSGLGSLRREVDLRWRTSPDVLASFPSRQLEILRGAARFVRPGGRLVYATCSPLRAEDEEVVEAFLAGEPGFAEGDAVAALPESARAAGDGARLRLWPDVHGGGGFFAALLVRRA